MAENKAPVDTLDSDLAADRPAASSGEAETAWDAAFEAPPEAGAQGDDEPADMELGELEAFLDDFNRSIGDEDGPEDPENPEGPDAATAAERSEPGDVWGESAGGLESASDSKEEFGRLMAEIEPPEPDAGSGTEEESFVDPDGLADDELNLAADGRQVPAAADDGRDEVGGPVFASAPDGAGASASAAEPNPADRRAEPAPAPPAGNGGERRTLIAAALGALGLTGAAAAAFAAYQLSAEVTVLEDRLATLQAGPASAESSALERQLERQGRELQKLEARLSELAIIIEGPISHLRESNERDIRTLDARLTEVAAAVETLQSAPPPREAAAPAATPAGPWAVNVISLTSRRVAREEQRRLAAEGIDTVLREATVGGKVWYRLQVEGFATKAQAEAYVAKVRRESGLSGAWVAR